jgi:hypothetical protein
MVSIKVRDTKGFVEDFLEEYLANGIGAKNKRDIDILVMHLFTKYAGIAEKSNHELSLLLQAPEAKIKGYLYEARLKYPPEQDYVEKEFLYTLSKSQFDFQKGVITFVMEDNYLRHAIQGKLKAKGMFADSSFNSELVKINRDSLEEIIRELYGKEIAGNFRDGFDGMEKQLEGDDGDLPRLFSETILKFIGEAAKSLGLGLVKSRLGF